MPALPHSTLALQGYWAGTCLEPETDHATEATLKSKLIRSSDNSSWRPPGFELLNLPTVAKPCDVWEAQRLRSTFVD
jgi:hypothetical protein